ncbi:hypothetical protein, partial [Paraburkholderia bannensis]|uniref:hypothetical protein n=1 Tax=Paraburkholderia bannensis TaxID=765414 RepID=UPI000489767F
MKVAGLCIVEFPLLSAEIVLENFDALALVVDAWVCANFLADGCNCEPHIATRLLSLRKIDPGR